MNGTRLTEAGAAEHASRGLVLSILFVALSAVALVLVGLSWGTSRAAPVLYATTAPADGGVPPGSFSGDCTLG